MQKVHKTIMSKISANKHEILFLLRISMRALKGDAYSTISFPLLYLHYENKIFTPAIGILCDI